MTNQWDLCAPEILDELDEGSSAMVMQSPIVIIHLEDGQAVSIKPGGMVDIAIHELGARLIEVEVLNPDETPITTQAK
ncbi:MAG: hypothetical protein KAJ19_24570 [Gammaproteobacteria bacterium]|nr:hypothetical protein [Gammaproteobacteria bacterium]